MRRGKASIVKYFPLAPWGEGVRRTGEGLIRGKNKYPSFIGEGAICHPELGSGSQETKSRRGQSDVHKMLKQVQHDGINNPLPQSFRRGRETEKFSSRFTLHSSLKRKAAFTLAEVLVTLGIIGVVSAMTVPTLMQNHQRKVYVTQMHKFYNELQQAAQQYMTDHNAVNLREAGLTSNEAIADFVNSYFKVVKDCGNTQDPCMSSNYKKLTGTELGDASGQPLNYTIASGVSFGCGPASTGTADNSRVAIFDVDINGQQGPNIAGRDVFIIGLFNNGIVDEYDLSTAPGDKDTRENLFNTKCNSDNSNWTGCFGKLLNDNWEMNY